jgi:HAD superfamily hydrolase (TIGR01549 family)
MSSKSNKIYKYSQLIFDFDGVLVESNEIRFEGFQILFNSFPVDKVERLVKYARLNGGMSRYEKIRYFFEDILNEPVTNDDVNALSKKYSEIVKEKVIKAKAVTGSLEFLAANNSKCLFAIVSGSDQEELREVCKARGINNYFIKMLGSPVSKEKNISRLLGELGWEKGSCLYIGDSINDFEAAQNNNIDFLARGSGLVDWDFVDNVTVIRDLTQLQLYIT